MASTRWPETGEKRPPMNSMVSRAPDSGTRFAISRPRSSAPGQAIASGLFRRGDPRHRYRQNPAARPAPSAFDKDEHPRAPKPRSKGFSKTEADRAQIPGHGHWPAMPPASMTVAAAMILASESRGEAATGLTPRAKISRSFASAAGAAADQWASARCRRRRQADGAAGTENLGDFDLIELKRGLRLAGASPACRPARRSRRMPISSTPPNGGAIALGPPRLGMSGAPARDDRGARPWRSAAGQACAWRRCGVGVGQGRRDGRIEKLH